MSAFDDAMKIAQDAQNAASSYTGGGTAPAQTVRPMTQAEQDAAFARFAQSSGGTPTQSGPRPTGGGSFGLGMPGFFNFSPSQTAPASTSSPSGQSTSAYTPSAQQGWTPGTSGSAVSAPPNYGAPAPWASGLSSKLVPLVLVAGAAFFFWPKLKKV